MVLPATAAASLDNLNGGIKHRVLVGPAGSHAENTAVSISPSSPPLEPISNLVPSPDYHIDHNLLPEPPHSALSEALSRGRWLLGLLIVQSTSSFVLEHYRDLLRDHIVVTLFLTMLVGAGGNAGNQSAIKVIRALATKSIRSSWQSAKNCVLEQTVVALLLGGGLSLGGFLRVYITNGNISNAFSISISLFLIVMTSVLLGTILPFILDRFGVDPANAGTSIQVIMDILGVAITCFSCHLILVQSAQGVLVERVQLAV